MSSLSGLHRNVALLILLMISALSMPTHSPLQAQEPLRIETQPFPNKEAFLSSFLERAGPFCINTGRVLNFGGVQAIVANESPFDDMFCDERGSLITIFSTGSSRAEVITVPNVDPLINHLRFFGSLALIGDCPEKAPRWPGCFPMPELGARAPVNLPPGAFFQALPPSGDRMTVDRFLNMCRLQRVDHA